jgi:hypothetical protein
MRRSLRTGASMTGTFSPRMWVSATVAIVMFYAIVYGIRLGFRAAWGG